MGCFLPCFGSSKRTKQNRRKLQRNASNKVEQPSVSIQDQSETLLIPPLQLQDNKTEERLSISTRKKVTFDSNVKTYEPDLIDDEAEDFPLEGNCEEKDGKEKALPKSNHSKPSSSEDSSVTSTGSYPPNHRYQNCRDSDDEDEVLDDWDSDLSDEDDDMGEEEEEECGELCEDFDGDGMSNVVDRVFCEEVESPLPRDVKSIVSNPNARDRSVYVHPVLNPVQNLSQWKVVKANKRTPPLRPQKENFVSSNHESQVAFGAKKSLETDTPKKLNQEIPVDASLSNWLGSSETTPINKGGFYAGTPDRCTGSNSVISHEDRPILGALTVEELKQMSATTSLRKSPRKSPDEMAIIGSVGSYWSSTGTTKDSGSASSFKGIPNTTSKYREDKKVNWHSTPFETRLEKALNQGAAEADSTYVPHVF